MQSMGGMGSFNGGSGSYDLSSTATATDSGDMKGGSNKFGSRNIAYGTSAVQSYTTIIVLVGVVIVGWYFFKKKK